MIKNLLKLAGAALLLWTLCDPKSQPQQPFMPKLPAGSMPLI